MSEPEDNHPANPLNSTDPQSSPDLTSTAEDRALGMNRRIARRDFLNGVAYGAAALAAQASLPWGRAAAATNAAPIQSSLLGQSEASNAVMHAIRDGTYTPPKAAPTGEIYDLVVVGAGISGLAAAHEFRRLQPKARILLIDPLADVGGHAQRNTFKVGGRTVIGYGGSQSLQSPSYFSPAVKEMLHSVSIEPKKFEGYYDGDWASRRQLEPGTYFDKAVFGRSATVRRVGKAASWVPQTPLNAKARRDLTELIDAPRDYLKGRSEAEKRALLSKMTYRDYLLKTVGADPQLDTYFADSTREYFGAGTDIVGALDAWANGNPGFDGLGLSGRPDKAMSPSGRLLATDPDKYIYHFPDGNASVARALLRSLIPAAVPGQGMETLPLVNVSAARLDVSGQPVRVRLSSTAVRVRHLGDPGSAKQVQVDYVYQGETRSVVAGRVVLACWHRVIPYLTGELGAAQVGALRDQVKVPLIYTNVVLRNWRAFEKLKLEAITSPGHFWIGADLDFPVSMGGYTFAQKASDPVVLHLRRIPGGQAGQDARTQSNAGRMEMTRLTLADYERQTRRLLAGALSGADFDPARDIAAISNNRWAHGYTYEYMRPNDAYWPAGPLPITAARRGWGRVAIANSDSGAYAYTHSAIDQGVRAVRELLGASGPAVSEFPGPPVGGLKLV